MRATGLMALLMAAMLPSPSRAESPQQPSEIYGSAVVQDMVGLVEAILPSTAFVLAMDEYGLVLQGSGVVVRSDGWIATSYELVSWTGVFEVQLLMEGELRAFEAHLVRTYPRLNLAVLRIPAGNLPVLPDASPDQARPGARVMGVGYPVYNQLERGLRITRGRLATPMMAESPARYPMMVAELLYVRGLSGSAVCTMTGDLVGLVVGADPETTERVRVLPISEVRDRVDAIAASYIVPIAER